MKKQLGIAMVLSLGLLSAHAALASDAVLGALLGGGAGAIVGRSIGGRDGTIIGGALGAAAGAAIASERNHAYVERRVEYAPPQGYYAPHPPPQQVYYAQPVRIVQQPVYYVQGGYDVRHHRNRGHERHDHGRWERY